MNKMIKKHNKLIATILIIMMPINIFATSISDNDGSAFITKAEFDSLKNNFQSQIDTYNQGIDSKIDTAIASYLSGISISKEKEVQVISYKDDAWWSFRNDQAIWKLGDMKVTLKSEDTSGGGSKGPFYMQWGTLTNELKSNFDNFRERLVKNFDWSNYTCEWVGYRQNVQSLRNMQPSYHWTEGGGSFGQATMSETHLVRAYSIPFDEGGTMTMNDWTYEYAVAHGGYAQYPLFYWSVCSQDGGKWGTAKGNHKGRFMYGDYAEFKREQATDASKVKIPDLCANMVMTFPNKLVSRINDADYIRSWCNDFDNTGLAKEVYTASWSDTEWACMNTGKNSTENVHLAVTDTVTAIDYDPPYLWHTTNTGAKNRYYTGKLYYGFLNPNVKDVTNIKCNTTSKMWTSTFDNYIESITDLDGYCTIITSGGKKHLALTAGIPLFAAEKDVEVELELEFEQKEMSTYEKVSGSKDHIVWLKVGSFKNDKNPNDDEGLIVAKSCSATNIAKLTSDQSASSYSSRGIVIPNGSKEKLKFIMPKDGYLFVKWSTNDADWEKGGGFLKLPKTAKITVED